MFLNVPERLQGSIIRDWKGHGVVPPVPMMTIQYYYSTRAVPPMTVMTIQSYDITRAVLRPIYYLTIVIG